MLVGAVLLVAAAVVAGAIHDSALAIAIAGGGILLVILPYLGDRVKSVGPSGIELFEAAKEEIASRIDADVSLTEALKKNTGAGQAAAAIRKAETPTELADVLVRILDRPTPERKFTTDDLLEAERELRARGYQGPR